jgi:thiol-disulfide isomerase/thioredoxin
MPLVLAASLLVFTMQQQPRDDARLTATCTANLAKIREALLKHLTAKGSYPNALSALVPKYLPDKSAVRCAGDRSNNGDPGQGGHADPAGGVSYSYEISDAPSGGMAIPPGPPPRSDLTSKPWGTERNVRLWLRRFYGDRPPIVRCLHHRDAEGPIALNLTLDGKIYAGGPNWEADLESVIAFARTATRELTADRASFTRNWKLSGISAATQGWSDAARAEKAVRPITELALVLQKNADELPDPADAERVACRLFAFSRDFESTEKSARALLARPGHADEEDALQLLAESLVGRGRYREAGAVYQRMLLHNPESKNIRASLADTLDASGREAEARELLDSIDPGRRLVGHKAPEFIAPLLHGGEISIARALEGKKAVLVNFWFLRCGPCREEFPKLQKLYEEFRAQGLEVLAINSDDERADVLRYATTSGWTFPIVLGVKNRESLNIPARYFVELFPTNYLIDSRGTIIYRHAGWNEASLRAALATAGIQSR